MKITLVFPPLSTLSGYPPCSLSALSSILRKNEIEAEPHDLNVEFFNYLMKNWGALSEEMGRSLHDRLQGKVQTNLSERMLIYYIQIIIPLIDKYMGEKSSMILHRYLDELINAYIFDDLLQRKNDYHHLRAPLDEVVKSVRANGNNRLIDDFIARYAWEDSDMVGFSLISEQQFPYALLFAQKIRERSPRTKFIMGGPYLTEMVDTLVRDRTIFDQFDYLVVHEGESALINIIEHERYGAPLVNPNVIAPSNIDAPKRPHYIEDIEAYGEQEFTGIDLAQYASFSDRGLPIYSSKGCTWCKCSFCSHDQVKNYREMSIPHFIEKMARIIEDTGVTHFQLCDEDVRPSRLEELVNELAERGLTIDWSIQTRFYADLSKELLRSLFTSGCRTIEFGLESGSLSILKRINKGISLNTVKRILADCEDVGIHAILNCMVGFPFETEEDAEELITLIDEVHGTLPKLVFLCNTQLVKIYKNSDFGKNPAKYGIGGIKGYELSPIMDWDHPEWIGSFTAKHRDHLLFSQKWSNVYDHSYGRTNNGPPALDDPIVTISDGWTYLRRDGQRPSYGLTPDDNNYLIQVSLNKLRLFRINDTMSDLLDIIHNDKPRLSAMKVRFLEEHSDFGTDDVTTVLFNGILALNEKGAISFHEC
jgi:hypothetical protein